MLNVLTPEIIKEAEKIECNRCGRCCILPSGKDCKYLLRTPQGKAHCKIYRRSSRIGTAIGEGQYCNNILSVPTMFEECPYNEVKKKIYATVQP